MNMLTNLKAAIANLTELDAERKSLEDRRAKAQAEIAAAASEKMTDRVEAKISRASNVATVCDVRLAKLESGSQPEADAVRTIYHAVRADWNRKVAVRRELARASFLNACLPHFDNDEKLCAERLAGILPLPLARLGRCGWIGFFPPPITAFDLLREIQCFINSVESESAANDIPIE